MPIYESLTLVLNPWDKEQFELFKEAFISWNPQAAIDKHLIRISRCEVFSFTLQCGELSHEAAEALADVFYRRLDLYNIDIYVEVSNDPQALKDIFSKIHGMEYEIDKQRFVFQFTGRGLLP